jgi:hypothetical protein
MRAYRLGPVMLLLAALTPSALSAQTANSTLPTGAAARNMNEVVCEKQKVPGSRLATAKVCKTRAEWAALRDQDRMDLERAQVQRGISQ